MQHTIKISHHSLRLGFEMTRVVVCHSDRT